MLVKAAAPGLLPRPGRREVARGRFRWLTATRSTIVQPGPVHSGLTADPAAELDISSTRWCADGPRQTGLGNRVAMTARGQKTRYLRSPDDVAQCHKVQTPRPA